MWCLFKLIKTLQFLLLFLFDYIKWKEIFRKEIKRNTSLLGTSNWSMRHSKNCRPRLILQLLRRPNSSRNTVYGPWLESRPSRRNKRVLILLNSRRSHLSTQCRISGWCTSTCEDQQQCHTAQTCTFLWKASSQFGRIHSCKREPDTLSRCQRAILPSIGKIFSWLWSESKCQRASLLAWSWTSSLNSTRSPCG